jgi:ribose transport system permease protein
MLITRRELGVFIFLILLAIVLTTQSEKFLTARNLLNVGRAASLVGIIAVGETFVIISGEFDISVGSIFGLAGVLAAFLMELNYNPWLAVAIALAAGLACGLLNGVLVTFGRIPSFIVTLGTLNVFRSLALILTDGRSANPLQGDLPRSILDPFFFLGQGMLFDVVPMQLVFMLLLMVIFGFVLHNTIFGFRVFAVGGSARAAAISGVDARWIKIMAFVLSGFAAAVAGVLNYAFLGLSEPTYGVGLELDVLAAVIIGGASLTGGAGSMFGTLVGAILLGVIRNGLVLLSVPAWWQTFFIGAVIILAVGADRWLAARRSR